MKKFFSLVLALVMALSLTTIAWGANELTATPATWSSVLASAQDGDTIKLESGNYGSLGDIAPAAKELTIVGSEGTIATYFGVADAYTGKITIKNIDFNVTNPWCSVCIAGVGTFAVEGCNFVVDEETTTNIGSAIYLSVQYPGDKEYSITGCSFVGEFGEGAVVIQNTSPDDYSVAVSANDFDDVEGESLAVWYKDSALDLEADVEEVTMVRTAAELEAAIAAADAGDTIKLMGGDVDVTNTVAITKPITIDTNGKTLTGLTAGAGVTTDASGKLTSGTFAAAPDADDVAKDYTVLKNTDGTYVVVPAVTMGDKFDLYLADVSMSTKLKLGAEDVSGLTFNEVGAKTNQDGSGRVAYIAANNGQFFVKTTNPTVADYAVTYAGKTDVLYYVYVGGTSAANFEYEESVTAFTNWGLTCGKMDNTGLDMTEDYFMASNFVVYQAGKAGTGTNYLLDGVVVSGTPLGTTIDHAFVANNFKYDATTKQNIPTSGICTKCLMQSTAIYKVGKAPAGSVVKPLAVDGKTGTWVVVPVATGYTGGTVVTPSTDKVQSAETFDAGIAMYVGMSVMAAAGSVVVLKKRED